MTLLGHYRNNPDSLEKEFMERARECRIAILTDFNEGLKKFDILLNKLKDLEDSVSDIQLHYSVERRITIEELQSIGKNTNE